MHELTMEELLKELPPGLRGSATIQIRDYGMTPQEIKEFYEEFGAL